MFRSRRSGTDDQKQDGEGTATATTADLSPLDELSSLLDELEMAVDTPMREYVESLIPSSYQEQMTTLLASSSTAKKSTSGSVLDSLKKLRNRTSNTKSTTTNTTTATPSNDNGKTDNEQTATTTTNGVDRASTDSSRSSSSSQFNFAVSKDPNARFLPTISLDRQERFVEVVRRISELVVYGERAAATIVSEKIKLNNLSSSSKGQEEKEKDEHNDTKDNVVNGGNDYQEEYERITTRIAESEPYASVFDFFFERNALSFITDILTGRAFSVDIHLNKLNKTLQLERTTKQEELNQLTKSSAAVDGTATAGSDSINASTSIVLQEAIEMIDLKLKGLEAINVDGKDIKDVTLLPPLAVATQGFQSVSILVQNVKRATSLFFILSNNHVNFLIDFPLDEYHIAERKKYQEANSPTANTLVSPRRFGSPELAELTTTFVTFLKSLALRMNAETLQFYLTYPADTAIEGDTDYLADQIDTQDDDEEDGERPMDEIASNSTANDNKKEVNRPVAVKHIDVDFPLYERALEFCSAHHDSFVRTTAMNICLNTLRLTTVTPGEGEEEPEANLAVEESLSSPEAALHNAKALPMRERLAIAQYVCAPSRVERLASPIFTKLAQLWSVLEEQFRELDDAAKSIKGRSTAKASTTAGTGDDVDDPASAKKKAVNEKVARAREKARRTKFTGIFNDASYNLQDELLLLEDLLQVGLTSFNEQTIEMMFATFVYPLLLQPLILYFQRSGVSVDLLFADAINANNGSSGSSVRPPDEANVESVKSLIAAPAKSALFCLSAVFQFVTNPPLLRLLFTAVFHPLSPDASGEILIRAKADVACIGHDGKATIRLDEVDDNGKMKCANDRSTYIFGTVTGRKEISGQKDNKASNETCVFVLAPALVEILEFDGADGRIVAKSRHNPYRKAIFQCFTLSPEVSDLHPLSVIAVDSAVSVFEKGFLSEILFGLDIKKYRDSLPTDKLSESFDAELDLDDRDIGGGPSSSGVESRLSLGAPAGGKVCFDYMNEAISSFKSCIIKAVPGGKGTWRLEYDMVAAHALLSSIRGNNTAIIGAFKAITERCRQSASFLSASPYAINKFAHNRLLSDISISKLSKKDELCYGAIMNMVAIRGSPVFEGSKSALHDAVMLKKEHQSIDKGITLHVSVSALGSYKELGVRACSFAPLQPEAAENAFKVGVESTQAWLKIDALTGMLRSLMDSDAIVDDVVSTFDPNTIYAGISDTFYQTLFGRIASVNDDVSTTIATSGTIINLVGKIAFPCVCEVSPSFAPLFSEAGAKVVSQGITWQSLYLVLLGDYLMLAEPEKRSNGQGRVVTSCALENLEVDRDPDNARMDTTARRLMLVHSSHDPTPPGLFQKEDSQTAKPPVTSVGPFVKLTNWTSSLDIWFEDNNAIKLAFKKVQERVSDARAHRGASICRYLSGDAKLPGGTND